MSDNHKDTHPPTDWTCTPIQLTPDELLNIKDQIKVFIPQDGVEEEPLPLSNRQKAFFLEQERNDLIKKACEQVSTNEEDEYEACNCTFK